MNGMYFQDGRASMASMAGKLAMVSDLFELDVISDEEALKACKTIIGQHTKKTGVKESDTDIKVIK